jgi:hypothetical protein
VSINIKNLDVSEQAVDRIDMFPTFLSGAHPYGPSDRLAFPADRLAFPADRLGCFARGVGIVSNRWAAERLDRVARDALRACNRPVATQTPACSWCAIRWAAWWRAISASIWAASRSRAD